MDYPEENVLNVHEEKLDVYIFCPLIRLKNMGAQTGIEERP